MKYIFILNPCAGKKSRYREYERQIMEIMKDSDIPYSVYITEYAGHATALAKNACESNIFIKIFVFGGDGTVNEAVNGAMGHGNCEIGVFPCGTGNDFVTALGYESTTIEKLIDGTAKVCDCYKVNNTYGANIVSVGFDSEVGRNVIKFKKIVSGNLAYLFSVAYCFVFKRRLKLRVKIDNKEEIVKSFLFVAAVNGRRYGGGFVPIPDSEISDGILDVLLVKNVSRLRMLFLIDIYKKGKITQPKYHKLAQRHSAESLEIYSEKMFYINIDGEIISATSAIIKIYKNALKFLIPVN